MTAALYTCAWRSRSAWGSQCDSPGPYTLYPSAAAWSSLAKPGPVPVRAMSSARRRASGSSLKCSNAAASPGCRSGCSCSALRRYAYVETKVAQTRPADAPECSERQIAPECSERQIAPECSERQIAPECSERPNQGLALREANWPWSGRLERGLALREANQGQPRPISRLGRAGRPST